jgi:hypothetical protein
VKAGPFYCYIPKDLFEETNLGMILNQKIKIFGALDGIFIWSQNFT